MVKAGRRFGNFSIGFRLSMGFTLILTFLLGAMGFTIYVRDREAFIEEFTGRGWAVVQAVNGYAYQAVKTGNRELLNGIVNSLVKEKYVMQVALLDPKGRVVTYAGSRIKPPSNPELSSAGKSEALLDEKGRVKAVSFLSPVTSEEGTVAGYLYVLYDFNPINDHLKKTMYYIIVNYIIACLAGVVLVRRVILNAVERPVKSLLAATERVSIGDFSHKLEVVSRDELGRLAQAFNTMMDQLGLLFGNIRNIMKDMIQSSDLIGQRSSYIEQYDGNGLDAGRKSELMKEINSAARRITRMGNQLNSLVQQFKTDS
ncbi:methyl-accepting chemotaxis protein [Thermosediminibacter litoriperuensis]|uniref:histidine kinase n=1 Tax=Thermosediminibacter litoriperuensis TaxID=291989 RepID=A0A5S5AQ54_9FIRM|nr:HAMP domain-containing protein [Thermosediminibacter litoriperuensis]TYP53777.1 HAMP domain-containing protein [Thermosediminibacter litoriperuensis]